MNNPKKNRPGDLVFNRVLETMAQHPPELADPEGLTEEILLAVARTTPEGNGRKYPHPRPAAGRLLVLQRLLAAASVSLLLILGVEQYGILSDINALERQNKQAALTLRQPSSTDRIRNRISGMTPSDRLTDRLLLKTVSSGQKLSSGLIYQNTILP